MIEREPGIQPIESSTCGCTLAFKRTGRKYQPAAALAVIDGLKVQSFTGVCEYYHAYAAEPGGVYRVGVGLFSEEESLPSELWAEFLQKPPGGFWKRFVEDVALSSSGGEEVRLDQLSCGSASTGELRAMMSHLGTAGFSAGLAVWISVPVLQSTGSPFTVACRTSILPKTGERGSVQDE